MLKKVNINWTKWFDWFWLKSEEIQNTLIKFNVHELDLEACLEWNQRSRIDNYPNYSFIVLHFPRYNPKLKIYELNEFNIFLWKDFLLTLRDYSIPNFDRIFDYYKDLKVNHNKDAIKFTSGYILYEIIQVMLEKMFNVVKNITLDIKTLEKQVFEKIDTSLVKDIMIKKRNIVVLKHMFQPQLQVLKQLENVVKEVHSQKIEVYFEDLEDKVEQVVNDIQILEEQIDTVEDAFKSIVDIKRNNDMAFLAIFSAFMLPLTLITSFYWMNIELPYADSPSFIHLLLVMTSIFMFLFYFYYKRNWKV